LGLRAGSSSLRTLGINCAGSNATRGLQSEGVVCERSGVDRGHPNACFVDLEEVGDQGIEVDVGVSEVVECQLLPIPGQRLVSKIARGTRGRDLLDQLTSGIRHPKFPC
jgi:hypothetical protein